MRSVNTDSLKITTKYFFYKPVQGFFRAFELEEYLKMRVKLEPPVMDLGCGDGTFGSILQESGVVDSIQISLDYSLKDILAGKNDHRFKGGIQADSRSLPLKNGSLASVFSNGVFCSLGSGNDIDSSISEVHRVLQDQGLFFVSLPTPCFSRNLPVAKILMKAGMRRIATYYLLRLNRRLTHENVLHESEWKEKLEAAGFSVDDVRYYFTPRQAYWWNILSFHFFRIFAIFQVLGMRSRRPLARFQEKIFRPVFEEEQSVPQSQKRATAGYLLFVSRKVANRSSEDV